MNQTVRDILDSGIGWQSKGAVLLLLSGRLVPGCPKELCRMLSCSALQARRIWRDLQPILPKLEIEVGRKTEIYQNRSESQSKRWGKAKQDHQLTTQIGVKHESSPLSPPLSPPIPPPISLSNPPSCLTVKSESKMRKSGKLKLEILAPSELKWFDDLWVIWPMRPDGRPSRGDKTAAQVCWKQIIDSGLATGQDLYNVGRYYVMHHPKVAEGWIRMVSTVFSITKGVWREILPEVQTHPSGAEVVEFVSIRALAAMSGLEK